MTENIRGIVVFAFGTPASISANTSLGLIAQKLASKRDLPIFTQPDIAIDKGYDVEFIAEKKNEPSPTLRIARAAVAWAQKHYINRLWIVAAAPHLWRCKRDLEMAIKEVGADIKLEVPHEIGNPKYSSWFSPESEQPRVRSLRAWLPREVLLGLMPFWLYARIAS